ncbi:MULTISPECIES: YHYH protein [Pacificibacter]|uniref:YHYH protein n=1 Tax=Pacificibacter TaxID=1042323 RepID=UPI001C0A597E|nr:MULTISPECIES: YHYH protein [Pacificibacter]MBU2936458.1 YHYH protein [Pacificibacter marinus]MDO6614741.1 YHYH protein [Pacificibacter sp. 1_MG-2023]
MKTKTTANSLSVITLSATLGAAFLLPANAQDTPRIDTSAAVASADWADNVSITVDDAADTFTFQSDGIPDHGFADKYLIPSDPTDQPFADKPAEFFDMVNSADYFVESPIDTTITTLPTYSEEVTDTSLGRIGVALSGAQIFNDYEDFERTVTAQDDQVIHDHVAFLDECNGHTLVDGSDYHYHGIPVCLTVRLDIEGEHSYMLGVLEDGFPVYANQDLNGAEIGSDELDECSGHVGATPEFPDGIYHYHLTADEAPYMIDCYHGEIEQASMTMGGGGPDLTGAATALGISTDTLRNALGAGGSPDFDAAAEALGISVDALMAVMPAPPQ